MIDIATFAARPPLRCFEIIDLRTGARCAADAVAARRRGATQPVGYFCRAHAITGDDPIRDDDVFRRVSVTLDILFAGVSWDRTIAQAEALAGLEAIVGAAGGVINLAACRSQLGRVGPLAARRAGGEPGGEG